MAWLRVELRDYGMASSNFGAKESRIQEYARMLSKRFGSLLALAIMPALAQVPNQVSRANADLDAHNQHALVSAQPLAGPDRPAEVPPDYVLTPFGYFHPSCVLTFESSAVLLADGRIQHADGSIDEEPVSCAYPHYLVSPRSDQTPSINGWVEDIETTTNPSYGELTSIWKVPSEPTTQNYQTVYFFPGFQDTNATGNNISILQPVLTWTGTGPWNISSWNCCLNGTADQSTPVNVSVGDTIYGSITSNCSSGSTSCQTWNVLSEDKTTGKSTTLGHTPSAGQIWNWAFGAVLEAYGISGCKQYPAAHTISFRTTLYNDSGQVISSPGWTGYLDTTDLPQCRYSQDASTLTLRY
jgi:hypothetical protein